MPPALVSAIVPVYNGEAYLAEALDSLQRQAYAPLEMIVVDDGSIDGSAAIAARYPALRYFHQANRGAAAARNAGLRLAQGELITFLDADDVWSDDKLRVQLGRLAAQPEAEVVLGYTQLVQQSSEAPRALAPLGKSGLVFHLANGLFRRRVFDRVGLFDEALRFSEDTDWFLRAWEADVSLLVHPETVLLYRRHGRNVTSDREMADKMFVTALKRSLDRRRKLASGAPAPWRGLPAKDQP